MRVLLSDGSGLTGRQAALALAAAGHEVGVLSATRLGIARFTGTVSRWHRVPRFGADPHRWLTAALARYERGRYDVLLPVQEQVAVLSWAAGRDLLAGVRTVVPPFAALARVQDKISAQQTLAEHDLPQPPTTVVRRLAGLVTWDRFPVYAKLPVGTASAGVVPIGSAAELPAAIAKLTAWGAFEDRASGVVVQDEVPGPLLMVQAVFDAGRLVALHACERVREGLGGGASHKRSVAAGRLRPLFERLGGALGWHGALSADVVDGADGPAVIDVNPRLVEPMNALLSGTDLVSPLIRLALHESPESAGEGRPGVRSHQALLALLRAAQEGRRALLAEALAARARRGDYADSTEELTPPERDWRARLPIAAVLAAGLVRPRLAQGLANAEVRAYALSPDAWRDLLGSDRSQP